MRRGLPDLPLLVVLMGIAALVMYLPAGHALFSRDYAVARPFFYGATVLLALTVMLGLATANRPAADRTANLLTALIGAYLVLPVMLALPFHQAIRDTSFLNAWFEMVSSLTTTGATLYDPPGRLGPTLHLWRALVGWLGGLFILIAATSILAPLNLGGVEVMSGRPPGGGGVDPRAADARDQIARTAAVILPAYAGLTALLWLILTLSGDSAFLALCHAMAILSTSGITPADAPPGATTGIMGEAFMFLFLIFAVTRRSLPGATPFLGHRPFLSDPELRLAVVIIAGLTGILVLRHAISTFDGETVVEMPGLIRAAWGALFTFLSFLTTTGFTSAEWEGTRFWSGLDDAPGLILAGLAMAGGGIATTAGGVKLLRLYALLRHGERELERQVHPSSVGGAGAAARRLRGEGAYLAWIFFMLFGLSIAVVAGGLALTGKDFEASVVYAIAALTTTGPLPLHWGTAGTNYLDLAPDAKVILAAAMIVGRVETLAILALFAGDRWRG